MIGAVVFCFNQLVEDNIPRTFSVAGLFRNLIRCVFRNAVSASGFVMVQRNRLVAWPDNFVPRNVSNLTESI
jgi:hypothetical protein